MYRKYIVNLSDNFMKELLSDAEAMKRYYCNYKIFRNKQIEKANLYCGGNNGYVDGTSIQNRIYPIEKYDIFISHSGKDKCQAIAFAAWLEKVFHVKVFVDCCLWGTLDDLENKIAQQTIEFIQDREIQQHANVLLANSLSNAIRNSECVFFLNSTSFSIDAQLEQTVSPWIAYEIGQVHIMKEEVPDYIGNAQASRGIRFKDSAGMFEHIISYRISKETKNIDVITDEEMLSWCLDYMRTHDYNYKEHPMIGLYKIVDRRGNM